MSLKPLLQSLFIETHRGGTAPPRYTLKDRDHRGLPSLYRLYMAMEDLTEWEFSQKYLDSWHHWQMLSECTWFKPVVARWRQEMELKVKSKALQRLQEMADLEGKERLQANKALLEYEKYLSKPLSRRVGRPKKEPKQPRILVSVHDDFDRLGLKKEETIN